MTALSRLLCAAALAAVAAAQQTAQPMAHPTDPLEAGGLNPFHIPAVRGSYLAGLAARGVDAGARHRRLQASPETGALPHFHDTFEFVGSTDSGFVDFKYNVIVANTTINSDDYVSTPSRRSARRAAPRRAEPHRAEPHRAAPCCALLLPYCAAKLYSALLRMRHAAPFLTSLSSSYPSSARQLDFLAVAGFTCVAMDATFAAPSDAAPHWVKGSLKRNNIRMSISLSAAQMGSDIMGSAAAHLDARLQAGMSLAFGIDTLGSHLNFAKGTSCAAQVPYTSPYFAVIAVSSAGIGGAAGGSTSWTLDLAPCGPMAMFVAANHNLTFNPDVEGELTRRRNESLPLGLDARSPGRRLSTTTAGFSMNYDPSTQKAEVSSLDLSDDGSLTCENCFVTFSTSVVFNFKVCFEYYAFSDTGYSDFARDTTNFDGDYGGIEKGTLPDCVGLGTIGTINGYTESTATADYMAGQSTNSFNFGFSAEAYVTGAAGYSYLLKGNTLSSAITVSGVDLFDPQTFPAISAIVGGITVSVTPSLSFAVGDITINAGWTGSWQVGSTLLITTKLGAMLSWPSVWDETGALTSPTPTTYSEFKSIQTDTPFTHSSNFNLTFVSFTVPIVPMLTLSVYDALPFNAALTFDTVLAFSKQQRRLLMGAAGARELQICSSGGILVTAQRDVKLTSFIGEVTSSGFFLAAISPIDATIADAVRPFLRDMVIYPTDLTPPPTSMTLVQPYDLITPLCILKCPAHAAVFGGACACMAGYKMNGAGTSVTCVACSAGTFSAAGATSCAACPAGFTSPAASAICSTASGVAVLPVASAYATPQASSVVVTAALAFSGPPLAAYASAQTIADLTLSIANAVAASVSTVSSPVVQIVSITDAAGEVLFSVAAGASHSRRRRLAGAAVSIVYNIVLPPSLAASSASIAAAVAPSGSGAASFAAAVGTQVLAVCATSGNSAFVAAGISAAVAAPPAPAAVPVAAAASPVVGIAVGVVVAVVAALSAAAFFLRKRGSPGAAKSTTLDKPKEHGDPVAPEGMRRPSSARIPKPEGERRPSSVDIVKHASERRSSSAGTPRPEGERRPSSAGIPKPETERRPSSAGISGPAGERRSSSAGTPKPAGLTVRIVNAAP